MPSHAKLGNQQFCMFIINAVLLIVPRLHRSSCLNLRVTSAHISLASLWITVSRSIFSSLSIPTSRAVHGKIEIFINKTKDTHAATLWRSPRARWEAQRLSCASLRDIRVQMEEMQEAPWNQICSSLQRKLEPLRISGIPLLWLT